MLSPQHHNAPVASSAQVCVAPAVTCIQSKAAPTGTGATWVSFAPSPSCPRVSSPQHHRLWSFAIPHACVNPSASELQRAVPATGVGTIAIAGVSEPMPSWPLELSPQQLAMPLVSIAHVCWLPAVTIAPVMITSGTKMA